MGFKNWWRGSNGPAFVLYVVKRTCRRALGKLKLLSGNCAGCGKFATNFDPYYEFFVCNKCLPDEVAYNLAEHVANPNGR